MARERYSKLTSAATIALLMGLLVGSIAQNVGATHKPADKVVASASYRTVVAPQDEHTILDATLRTSKPTDLMFHVTLECSILTRLATGSSPIPTSSDDASAHGEARIWIEIGPEEDPRIVPIVSSSEPPQDGSDPNSGSKFGDSVTFCNRVYSRHVNDGEGPDDGIDREDDYIRTKMANAFNWILLNAGAGVHQVRVKATLTTNTTGEAHAEAIIGNRTLLVVPAKLANDATVSETAP